MGFAEARWWLSSPRHPEGPEEGGRIRPEEDGVTPPAGHAPLKNQDGLPGRNPETTMHN